MSWGLSPWGLSPWGIGDEPSFAIVRAVALSTLVVRVTLTRSARALSGSGVGDALNPRTWGVVDELGNLYTVLAVRNVQVQEVFDLYLLQHLGPQGVVHTVSAPDLLDIIGGAIDLPAQEDFGGISVAKNPKATSLAMQDFSSGGDRQSLRIGTDGDYEKESGPQLIRKLIVRRLTTAQGGFVHLPDYGLGIKLKEPLTVPRMATLKRDMERALKNEAEIETAQVSVRLTGAALEVLVAVKLFDSNTEVRELFQVQQVTT